MQLNDPRRKENPARRKGQHCQGRQRDFTEDWRCHDCGKLLGKSNGEMMHIRRKPAEFTASLPITAKCPGCGSLNLKNKP